MAYETREIEFAKELDDVLVLLRDVVVVIKNGGDYTSLIPQLVAAISDIQEIPAEFAQDEIKCIANSMPRIGEIIRPLIGK